MKALSTGIDQFIEVHLVLTKPHEDLGVKGPVNLICVANAHDPRGSKAELSGVFQTHSPSSSSFFANQYKSCQTKTATPTAVSLLTTLKVCADGRTSKRVDGC